MMKVGLTGGIGSGKSTVARIFALEGVPVYTADDRSKWLLEHDPQVVKAIKESLGEDLYDVSGRARRAEIARRVFSDERLLTTLNSIMHPAVARDFERWSREHAEAPYGIEEAAVLFESGADRMMDCIVTVTSPIPVRVLRAMRRDNASREQIEARITAQMSDEQRIARSDYQIISDDCQLVIPQVLALHRTLLRRSSEQSYRYSSSE